MQLGTQNFLSEVIMGAYLAKSSNSQILYLSHYKDDFVVDRLNARRFSSYDEALKFRNNNKELFGSKTFIRVNNRLVEI